MEEKTGKIINVENATERQKNQKLGLKLKIAALCTAIGISGIAVINNLNNTNNDNSVSIETNIDMDMDSFEQLSDIDQQNIIIAKAQGEVQNSYYIVVDYYKTNGEVEGIPDELREAYNRLGNNNYLLAKNEGIEFYNNINGIKEELPRVALSVDNVSYEDNQIPLNVEMNMDSFYQMSDIDQQNIIIAKARGEVQNSYYIVVDYYKTNGMVEGIPDELREAYNRLGNDNYILAMNEGIEFYNKVSGVTISAESGRSK